MAAMMIPAIIVSPAPMGNASGDCEQPAIPMTKTVSPKMIRVTEADRRMQPILGPYSEQTRLSLSLAPAPHLHLLRLARRASIRSPRRQDKEVEDRNFRVAVRRTAMATVEDDDRATPLTETLTAILPSLYWC
jgi:hypothetical protein